MRPPRLTVLRMMIVVAAFALASLGWREYRASLLRKRSRDPAVNSRINARLPQFGRKYPLAPGRPLPVTVTYDFKLSRPTPGKSSVILGMVWLEDLGSKRPIATYTFDAELVGGKREACSGSFVWEAAVPRPGRYMLHFHRYYEAEDANLIPTNGGAGFYEIVEEEP